MLIDIPEGAAVLVFHSDGTIRALKGAAESDITGNAASPFIAATAALNYLRGEAVWAKVYEKFHADFADFETKRRGMN